MSVSVSHKFIRVSRGQKSALEFLHSVDPKGKGVQFEEWMDGLLDSAREARQKEIIKG